MQGGERERARASANAALSVDHVTTNTAVNKTDNVVDERREAADRANRVCRLRDGIVPLAV